MKCGSKTPSIDSNILTPFFHKQPLMQKIDTRQRLNDNWAKKLDQWSDLPHSHVGRDISIGT